MGGRVGGDELSAVEAGDNRPEEIDLGLIGGLVVDGPELALARFRPSADSMMTPLTTSVVIGNRPDNTNSSGLDVTTLPIRAAIPRAIIAMRT